jgi:hypothetical protein
MRVKPMTLLSVSFAVFMFVLFVFFAFSVKNLWISAGIGALLAIAIAAEIHHQLRYKRANKKERHRIESQKPLRRYFYDRWYTTAGSTQSDHLKEELLETKKKIRRK